MSAAIPSTNGAARVSKEISLDVAEGSLAEHIRCSPRRFSVGCGTKIVWRHEDSRVARGAAQVVARTLQRRRSNLILGVTVDQVVKARDDLGVASIRVDRRTVP